MFKWENKIATNYLTQGFPLSSLTHHFKISGLKYFILLKIINHRGTYKININANLT